tara:strand:- start:182 stop:886 length:705 start_codon:yes stop_codon:yes gene_type:complete
MWEFVESVRGVAEACNQIKLKHNQKHPTPIIAGNVSFYNESKSGAIPPSPIVSCLGKLENIDKTISMSFKKENSTILMLGLRKNEMGGSLFYQLNNELGANVPNPDLNEVKKQIYAITDCIDQSLLNSCHDISDGGLAVALAEMSFKNEIGFDIKIKQDYNDGVLLFSETGGFVLETDNDNINDVENIFNKYNLNFQNIGKTNNSSRLRINESINLELKKAKTLWENGLRNKLK